MPSQVYIADSGGGGGNRMGIVEIANGYRLSRSGRSILLHLMAWSKIGVRFTDKDLLNMGSAFQTYLDDMNGNLDKTYVRNRVTSPAAPPLGNDVAYKFTDDEGLSFWRRGSIRLNPLHYYHSIENQLSRDAREGMGLLCVQGPLRSFTAHALSGFNAYALCLSSDARKSERQLRHAKFGKRLLRINGLTEFSEKIVSSIGAERTTIRDIVYSDIKVVRAESSLPDEFAARNGIGDLQMVALEYLAESEVDNLIQYVEAASAFTKPCLHHDERERRILFTMPKDVSDSTSVARDDLAEHIEVIV
jgi:hypothetical protein